MYYFSSKSKLIWLTLPFLILYGCSKTAPPVPVASFTINSTSLTSPATVTFTNTSTNATSYTWDFGDGGTSFATSPTYTYTKGGNYTVKLTATGSRDQNSVSKAINITDPTSLEISVKDNLGNPVSGATVKLYSTESDWISETFQVLTTQTTNSSGVVIFKPLAASKYFWKISKGCQSNIYTTYTSTSALTSNINNLVTSILGSTGTLTIINNSTYPYDIYLNGTLQFVNMAGGSRKDLLVPTGNYTIRVLQKSGYVLTPTDKTYTGSLVCGGTLSTTFP